MVNRGRSGGCITCKGRRVKCDETKPKCRACQRLGYKCEGYQTKYSSLKFKDQNYRFQSPESSSRASSAETQVSSPRSPADPDTSVSFFLQYYAGMGRNMGSARGFFEVLIPVFNSQPQDSALSLAVSAVASEVLSLWRHDHRQSSRETYTKAVVGLRSAMQDKHELGKPATMMTVIALQLYETLVAVYGLRSGTHVHHNGALSLLPFANSDNANDVTNIYVQRFILHSEVCSALRQERPLQHIARSWIEDRCLTAVPDNPSSELDLIGAAVAELQAKFKQFVSQGTAMGPSPQISREIRAEAKILDERLEAWAVTIPQYWQPPKLRSGEHIDPCIPTYRSTCEIYPTSQIGVIWNLWRIQRILLLRVIVGTLMVSDPEQSGAFNNQFASPDQDFLEYTPIFQELVDSICHSVPFFIGNRSKTSILNDFSDTKIMLPSYHCLGEGSIQSLGLDNREWQTSIDEHRRSIIAQGPWHIMHPLSRLLTLFSEGHGQLMATFLRPWQQEWIREQFLRVTTLLWLSPGDDRTIPKTPPMSKTAIDEPVETEIEYLAKGIRKGATYMSGP